MKNLLTLRAFLGRGIAAVDQYMQQEAMNGTKEQLENDLGMIMSAVVLVTETSGLSEDAIVASAESMVNEFEQEDRSGASVQ